MTALFDPWLTAVISVLVIVCTALVASVAAMAAKIDRIERRFKDDNEHAMRALRWLDAQMASEHMEPANLGAKLDEALARLGAFQGRTFEWMLQCFGQEIALDRTERCHRFFEEAAETVQSLGMTKSEAHQLVDYVWGRPEGETIQEIGGVMVTLAALSEACGLSMDECAEIELVRVWLNIEKIRTKQAAKPKHSPLPV